jgi:hypothetical protein
MFDQTPIVLSLAANDQPIIPFIYVVYALLAVPALMIYFLPTSIANWRERKSRRAIFWLNLLLGWTFVGWTIALIWAISEVTTIFPPEPVIRLGYYDHTEGRKGLAMIGHALDRAFTDAIRDVPDSLKLAVGLLITGGACFGLAALLPLGAPWSYIGVVLLYFAWIWTCGSAVIGVFHPVLEFFRTLRSHFVTYDAFTCKVCSAKRTVRHPAASKKCNSCGAIYQIAWEPTGRYGFPL